MAAYGHQVLAAKSKEESKRLVTYEDLTASTEPEERLLLRIKHSKPIIQVTTTKHTTTPDIMHAATTTDARHALNVCA